MALKTRNRGEQVATCSEVLTSTVTDGKTGEIKSKKTYRLVLNGLEFDVLGLEKYGADAGHQFRPSFRMGSVPYTDKDGRIRGRVAPIAGWLPVSEKQTESFAVCYEVSPRQVPQNGKLEKKNLYSMYFMDVDFELWESSAFKAKEGQEFRPYVKLEAVGFVNSDGFPDSRLVPSVAWEAVAEPAEPPEGEPA